MNSALTPQLRARICAREKRAADAAAAVLRQHRYAELGVLLAARDVRRTDEVQNVVINAEGRIALEIDARHIGTHRVVVDRNAEAQPAIFAVEGEEMRLERRPLQPGKLANRNVGQIFSKDARAAASVASISAAPCAADTKPASYAEGARYTPRVNIS